MPQASFTMFREGEVQDWDQIGYFVPGFHTFYHVLRGRSTGLELNLVLRPGGVRREFTRFDVRPFLLDGLTSDIDFAVAALSRRSSPWAELRSLLRTAGWRICQRWCLVTRYS